MKKRSYTEMRRYGVPRMECESHPDYVKRATDIRDVKHCRRAWYEQHQDLKLIAVQVNRPIEWVREVIAYRRHGSV